MSFFKKEELTRSELVIGLSVVLFLVLLVLSQGAFKSVTQSPKVLTEERDVPPFTEEIQAQLAASNGFQALVSYTDRGFEPQKLSIQQGETIRFTNNSSEDLWVAANGDRLYPQEGDGCGSSALDSCKPIKPRGFWEFTFEEAGSWVVKNNLDESKKTVVEVK